MHSTHACRRAIGRLVRVDLQSVVLHYCTPTLSPCFSIHGSRHRLNLISGLISIKICTCTPLEHIGYDCKIGNFNIMHKNVKHWSVISANTTTTEWCFILFYYGVRTRFRETIVRIGNRRDRRDRNIVLVTFDARVTWLHVFPARAFFERLWKADGN